jgi:hypothetical protein
MDGERQHEPFDYRMKCIDDHEQRLRHLESNSKEQSKFIAMSEKLESQIVGLDEKVAIRFKPIERWIDAQVATAASELLTKKDRMTEKRDWNSYIFSGISITISLILLCLRALGK